MQQASDLESVTHDSTKEREAIPRHLTASAPLLRAGFAKDILFSIISSSSLLFSFYPSSPPIETSESSLIYFYRNLMVVLMKVSSPFQNEDWTTMRRYEGIQQNDVLYILFLSEMIHFC